MKRFCKFSFLVLVASFIFASCNVGLGEAVDTQPPTLSIESPSDGLIIMNTFTMQGSASDETSVAKVQISLIPTNESSGTKTYGPFDATVDNSKKTWTCNINNYNEETNTFEILDGEYTAQVTATDSAGRTTTQTRVYKIDNTEPVVILSRPTMSDQFGKTVKVTGDIADNNSLSSLYFSVYKKNDGGKLEFLETIRKENVSGTGLEIVLAQKIDEPKTEEEIELNTLYDKFYPNGQTDDVELYCIVEVSDSAEESIAKGSGIKSRLRKPNGGAYESSANETLKGNLSTCYYLNNTIYQTVLGGGYKLSKSQLVTVFNGTYARNGIAEETATQVKKYLSENSIQTKDSSTLTVDGISMFRLNPNNSPLYEVPGYKYGSTSDNSFTNIYNEESLQLTVSSGTDGYALVPDSIRIVLKECDDFGKEVEGANEIVLLESKENIEKLKTTDSAKYEEQLAKYEKITSNKENWSAGDSSIRIRVEIGNQKVKTNYLVKVQGRDIAGNETEASGGAKYGIRVIAITSKPPVVVVSKPADGEAGSVSGGYSNTAKLDVAGTFEYSAETVDIYYRLYALKSEGNAGDSEYYFPLKDAGLNKDAQAADESKCDYRTLKDGVVENCYKELPTLKFDEGKKSGTWSILNSDATLSEEFRTAIENFCSKIPDESEYTLYAYFIACDDEKNNSEEKEWNIHIDKINPSAEINSVNPLVERNGLDSNVNGVITVQGTASDNDKISATELSLRVGTAKTDSDGKFVSWEEGKTVDITGLSEAAIKTELNSGDKFKYSIDTTKLKKEGSAGQTPDKEWLEIRAETTDRSGNKNTVSQIVYIDQSTDIPLLSSSNLTLEAEESAVTNNVNLFGMGLGKINLAAEDDDGIKSVSYKIDGGTETKLSYTDGKTSKSVEIKLPENLAPGMHCIEFTVEDTQGEINKNIKPCKTKPTYFAIDNDTPVFSDIKVVPEGTADADAKVYVSGMYVSSKYKLTGTVSDSNKVALVYKKGDESKTNLLEEGKQTWVYKQETAESDGEKTVAFVAEDKFGRDSEISLKYKIDSQAPALDSNTKLLFKYDASDEVDSSDKVLEKTWIKSCTITLTGKVSDNIELGEMALTINGVKTSYPGYSGAKTAEFKLLNDTYADGENTVVLDIFDGAGNKLSRTFNVKVDSKLPELNEFALEGADENGKLITKNDTIKARIKAKDETSGLARISIGLQTNADDNSVIISPAVNEYEKTVTLGITGEKWTEGSHSLYVRAIDVAGHVSVEKLVEGLVIDRTAPVVGYTSHNQNGTVNKTIELKGTVSDANLASSAAPVLYYRKSAANSAPAGEWKEPEAGWNWELNTVSNGIWTISNIDTTKLYNELTEGGCSYDFQVRFTDLAGNSTSPENGKILTLKIDQTSDRPRIELSNINIDGNTRLNSSTVVGRIEDDDGDVKELWIKTSKDAEFVKVSVSNSNWSYDLPKDANNTADGNYELYFKVVDSKNTTFETDGSDGAAKLELPYILYQTKKTCKPVKFSVDTTAPAISEVSVSFDEGASYSAVGNNQKFGGTHYKNAIFKVIAKDSVTSAENLIVMLELDNGVSKKLDYSSSTNAYECSLDCSAIESNIYQLKITATDEAKMTQSFSKPVIIDNTAPDTIRNVAPNSGTQVTGEFDFSGLIQDDENANSGVKDGTLRYYIPKYAEKDYEDSALANIPDVDDAKKATEGWKHVKDATSVSWKIEFKTLAEDLGYNYSEEKLSSDYEEYRDSSNKDLFKIPIWFKAEDTVGNVGYIKNCVYIGETDKKPIQLKFNPNADKPTVEITYPEHDKTGEGSDIDLKYTILGGTVRFAGIASDNEGIEAVYLQFDMDGDDEFENGIKADGSRINGCPFTKDKVVSIPKKGEKGVKVEKGTISWSYSLDVSNLQGLSYADDNKVLRVRACAVDSDTANGQLASAWSNVVNISVNNSVPQITVEKLRQYADSDSSLDNPIKEVGYNEGDYISGLNWYLEGYFEDSDGIDLDGTKAKVNGIEVEGHFEKADVTDSTGKKYTFKIPVSSKSGACTVSLVVKDKDSENPQTTTKESTIKIDNTAPEFYGDNKKLVLYKDSYGSEDSKLDDISNFIQNKNGSTTIATRVEEADSGFSRAVFYFTRTYEKEAGKPVRVFNVMEDYGSDRTANRTEIGASKVDGSVYINGESLPVLYKGTITRGNDSQLSYSGLGSNKNIRKAGLVKIGGAYHKILGISGDTLTFKDECSTSFTEAEFVYAMVADNNDNGEISRDDGDAMAESYSKAGDYWTWDATINSTNIPDGPVTVNVVVFDKAGNFAHGSVKTRISNSPVRITSVKLATDLNSNGTFEESEYEQFYAFKNADGSANTSKGIDVWNLDTKEELYGNSPTGKYWAVKDRLAVVPEFVGGTGPFYWNFTKSEAGENLESAKSLAAQDSIKIENKQEFILGNAELDESTGEGKDVAYQFSFWDSTEELTPGTDTSWTVLNAHVRQELTDSVAPTITIKPFYWNSGSDNSLYRNSKEEGHIELEGDLDFAGSAFTQNSGLYDKDPKVSGRIKIQGSANDNKILNDIKIEIPGLLNETVGTYTKGSGWNDSRTEGEVEAKLESGSSWTFTIDEEEISQESGHTVKWTLTVDTSKISGVAKLDVAAKASATDQSSNPSQPSAAQTAQDNETSYYRMDVVPYITEVKTMLSNSQKRNPSVYSRTALGHYSVASDETVTISGFNLKEGNSNIEKNISEINTSGAFVLKVNNVETLNNKNNNNARGDFSKSSDSKTGDYAIHSNYYNRKPNNLNNNLLDDDVYFDVWQINSKAAAPVSGMIEQPVMKINPVSGMVGFAFVNGPLYFSMGGKESGTEYSAQYWMGSYDFFTSVGFVYDKLGYSYGCAAGGDINSSAADKFQLMTSRWGRANTGQEGSYDDTNSLRMESIAQKDGSGVRIFDKQRIKSPSFATAVHGNSTNLYLAYYDNLNDEIRFKYGSINSTGETNFGSFNDYDILKDAYVYRNAYVSMIAGSDTGRNAGEYVSIAVVSSEGTSVDDVVVAVWYDSTERCLRYSYNRTPTTDRNANTNAAGWSTPETVFTGDMENAGEWCQIMADKSGGIHIAAYDPINLDLVYAYKSSYSASSFETCIVDGYGVVGSNLTLDVAKNASGKWIPYIGYYATSCVKPKIAYLADTSSNTPAGTIDDEVTKAWEISVIPTTNTIPLGSQGNNKMNVGVWKNKDSWQIKNSVTGTNTGSHSGSSYGATCWDKVYGNGTANPIMGYAIKSGAAGYIETAQMK